MQIGEPPDAGGSHAALVVHPPALDDLVAPARVINFIKTDLGTLPVLVEYGVVVERPSRGVFHIEKNDVEVALPPPFGVVELAVIVNDDVLETVFAKDLVR